MDNRASRPGPAPDLVLAGSQLGRLVASLGVAVVATTSLVNLADTGTSLSRPRSLVAPVADRIVEIAKKQGARYGYADYWDASSLTWSTHMAVQVAPVSQCVPPKTDLCPFWFNVNTNWYRPRPNSNTFVLRDSPGQTISAATRMSAAVWAREVAALTAAS